MQAISYSQRFEDHYLLRCFGAQPDGFYIDIGAGHPVFDNVSFAFYLRGWRGITVEPNPALAALARAVRRRDIVVEAAVGATAGEAMLHLVDDFHGLSTVIDANAQAARTIFGKGSQPLRVPATTLAALCAAHAPARVDFLKIDVEGLEGEVLRGGDFTRFRPRVIVVEALAPFTLAPAWEAWEPLLVHHGYRYVWFDSLNRYYLAPEAEELARRFADAPAVPEGVMQYREYRPALADEGHPDHGLAALLARAFMIRLPLLDRGLLLALATAEVLPAELGRAADTEDLAAIAARLLGRAPAPAELAAIAPAAGATIRDLYAAVIDSDPFRTACGRISAGYAW